MSLSVRVTTMLNVPFVLRSKALKCALEIKLFRAADTTQQSAQQGLL